MSAHNGNHNLPKPKFRLSLSARRVILYIQQPGFHTLPGPSSPAAAAAGLSCAYVYAAGISRPNAKLGQTPPRQELDAVALIIHHIHARCIDNRAKCDFRGRGYHNATVFFVLVFFLYFAARWSLWCVASLRENLLCIGAIEWWIGAYIARGTGCKLIEIRESSHHRVTSEKRWMRNISFWDMFMYVMTHVAWNIYTTLKLQAFVSATSELAAKTCLKVGWKIQNTSVETRATANKVRDELVSFPNFNSPVCIHRDLYYINRESFRFWVKGQYFHFNFSFSSL